MINYEIDWLDQVSLSNLGKCSSWSKHHSAQVAPSTVTPGIHSMLPLIKKSSLREGSIPLHEYHPQNN